MPWTDAELSALLLQLRARQGDSTQVEVKLGRGGVPGCAETLCAFGNMPGGGTLIVGLDEEDDFAAVGVASVALTEAGLAAQARTAVVPPVAVDFQVARVDDVEIVVATVAGLPSHERPCRTGGRAYLRQADGDYVMSEQEIQQVVALRERPRHDAAVIDSSTAEDLDDSLARAYLSAVRPSSRRLGDLPNTEILQRKRVQHGQSLTIGGAYALGSFPQEFEPSLSITAAVQLPHGDGARTRDLQHMDGPLPELLEAAMKWVRRNTRTTIRVGRDGRARDVPEIPMVAVRELVANALVHRDLGPHTRGKRVEIRLLDDKLVITNPGGLWGISSDQLGKSEGKWAVNEFLYDICKYTRTSEDVRVIEGEGGGIREVEASLRSAGLAPPRYIDKGISFTVIVPRHALLPADDVAWLAANDADHRLSSMESQILTSMRHGQVWANSTVRDEFPSTDSREAGRALRHLVELGFAEALGERGGRQYRLDPRWKVRALPNRPTVVVSAPARPATQDELPDLMASDHDDSTRDLALSKTRGHSAERGAPSRRAVLLALSEGPLTVRAIAGSTGLSIDSVRNALRRLIDEGDVRVNGGWGVKGTTYEVTGAPPRS